MKLQQIIPLVLFALFALAALLRRRSTRRGLYIDPTSLQWKEAVAKAQASVPLLRQLHASGVSPLIKYAIRGGGGELEHVWGELESLEQESFSATLETPMLHPPASLTPPFSMPLSALEDWQAFLSDGSIRGGYTAQAEIALHRNAGKRLPPHVAAMEGHFVDG